MIGKLCSLLSLLCSLTSNNQTNEIREGWELQVQVFDETDNPFTSQLILLFHPVYSLILLLRLQPRITRRQEKMSIHECSNLLLSQKWEILSLRISDDPRPEFQELLERWLLSVSFRWVRKSSSISIWSLLAFVIPLLPFFSDEVSFLNLTIWHRAAPDMRYNATSSSRLIMWGTCLAWAKLYASVWAKS